jgi:hypothetical protein
MNTSSLLASAFVISSLLGTVACSAGAGDDGGGTMDSTGASPGAGAAQDMGLVSHCDGTYDCSYNGSSVVTHVQRDGDRCMAGQTELTADGVAKSSSGTMTWRGDRNAFTLCAGSACIACKNQSPVSAAPAASSSGGSASPSGKCTGSLSCNGSPPCGPLGCYMHTHYHYDGKGNVSYTDYTCEGSPSNRCEDYSSESTCKSSGCTWK